MTIDDANSRQEKARREFSVRYFKWAQQQADREFEGASPFLTRLNSPIAEKILYFADTLSQKKRYVLSSALVKRAHPDALEILDECTSQQEEQIVQELLAFMRDSPSSSSTTIRSRSKASKSQRQFNRWKRGIPQMLTPILGKPYSFTSGCSVWNHRTYVQGWTVESWFDTGSTALIRYHHSIAGGENLWLKENCSLMNWLGISSETAFYLPSSNDYSDVSLCLREICEHFMTNLPGLLNGIPVVHAEVSVHYREDLAIVESVFKNGLTKLAIVSPEVKSAMPSKVFWKIPTSIIPEEYRNVGSYLRLIVDPNFVRKGGSKQEQKSEFRHVRIVAL